MRICLLLLLLQLSALGNTFPDNLHAAMHRWSKGTVDLLRKDSDLVYVLFQETSLDRRNYRNGGAGEVTKIAFDEMKRHGKFARISYSKIRVDEEFGVRCAYMYLQYLRQHLGRNYTVAAYHSGISGRDSLSGKRYALQIKTLKRVYCKSVSELLK